MDKSDSQAEGETDVKYEENVLESEEEEEDFGSDEDDDDSDDDVNDDDDDNSDDDDDDNDDDDDEEDDDDDEIDEGDEAVLEASDSDGTDDTERCPICLNRFKDQDIGTPESCDHMFCLECIQEWSKNVNTCPSDRLVFKLILCKHGVDDVIYKKISVEDKNVMAEEEEANEEPTYCEVCNECNREDRLLLCDGCDLGYHLECLNPPLDTVPVDEWFCPACARREGIVAERDSDYIPGGRQRWRRQIPRTLVMERVRSAIEEIRVRRTRNLTRLISSDEDDDDGEEATSNMDAATPSTSSAPKPSPKKRKTPAKRKIKRRYRKRKTKRKSTAKKKTTKTTPKKTPVKRKTKRKRKAGRKKKRGKRVKRLARTAKPPTVTTVKSRIAGALGISSPPPGCTIPVQKKTDKSTDLRRPDLSGTSFSIFGDKEELNFFEE
ncbi:PHD and RING finger domain-containing protein 1 [Mactra antiquata]